MAVTFTQPIASHGGLNWDTNLEAALTELKTKANRADQTIPSTDLSQITESGWYYGSSLTNAPIGSTGPFMIFDGHRVDGTVGAQLAIGTNSGGVLYMRRRSASVWGAWNQVVTDAGDTGWVTSSTGITAGTGFTLTATRYRILNGVVSIGLVGSRTGAAITANASGIITVTDIATLPASLTPTVTNGAIINNGSAATVQASGYANSGGLIRLATATPSVGIPTSAGIDLMGTYLL
jgi:hypothetical protein